MATLLGALAGTYFLAEPIWSFRLANAHAPIGMVLFVLTGTIISGLSESLHRARRRFVAQERQRVEEALRETEERFRQLAENIHEIFWITDARDDRLLYISPGY